MSKCIELGLTEICFESDFAQLINAPLMTGAYRWQFMECWISREVNEVLDKLAKQCLNVAEAFMAGTQPSMSE
ncbi:hypothetical protein Bca4012_081308 [Brassica carinata]